MITENESEGNSVKRKKGANKYWRIIKGNLYARLQYTDEFGKKREKVKPINDKRSAKRIVEEMRDEFEKHGADVLTSDKLTFADLADKYEAHKIFPAAIHSGRKVGGLKSWKTVKGQLEKLKQHFGEKLIRSVKPSDIETYKRQRLNTKTRRGTVLTIASVNRELSLLKAMFSFAERESYVLSNPCKKVENLIQLSSETERERIMSFNEEICLLTLCTNRREHLKPIIVCAVDTAMRPDELFKLTWKDVDLEGNYIRVIAENSKTEKERTVFLSSRLKSELEKLWKNSPQKVSFSVFGIKSIKTAWRNMCDECRIKDLRFRDLRHTGITRMILAGYSQAEVMKMTGHTQMKTFLRYLNLTPETMSEKSNLMNDYLNRKRENADQIIYEETIN